MNSQTTGTIISVLKVWWLKVNSKPFRTLGTSGALYPHIIKVEYTVDGQKYIRRKWVNADQPTPKVGGNVRILYSSTKPTKAKIL